MVSQPLEKAVSHNKQISVDQLNRSINTAVTFLLQAKNPEGWWEDYNFPQAASIADEWVTAFVGTMLAIVPDARIPEALKRAWALLETRNHRSTGEWGYNYILCADGDTTSWALKLAEIVGASNSERAKQATAALATHLQPDGGLATFSFEPIRAYIKVPDLSEVSFAGWCSTASTSISAALGMALARDMKGENFKVVAVIGDGALTGGMALEAINHAGYLPKTNLLVVLNDNEMSISPNVGALSSHLNQLRFSRPVQLLKKLEEQFETITHMDSLVPELNCLKQGIKRLAVPKVGAVFEELGFTYMGPIDGHNLEELIATFEQAHQQPGPVLVHVATVKGKGYEIAEQEKVGYHAQNKFDLTTGKAIAGSSPKPPSYSKIFGDTLTKIATTNPKVIGITAAMSTGTGLDILQKTLPQQFIDVGIAEQHAVTLAAGLACERMRPVVAIYSTFLQRAFDQIVHDVCIQNLPVFFCIDRAGIVGADGPTHQGMYDIAYLRCIPNMVLMAPKDEAELQQMLVTGINYTNGPITMRFPRGNGYGVSLMAEGWEPLPIGKGEILRYGEDVLIVAYGSMVYPAVQAATILSEQGIEATVVNARFAKPLDTDLIVPLAEKFGRVFTLEEGCLSGGFGSAVAEALLDHHVVVPVIRIGVPDQLVEHATPEESKLELGLSSSQIAERVKKEVQHKLAVQVLRHDLLAQKTAAAIGS